MADAPEGDAGPPALLLPGPAEDPLAPPVAVVTPVAPAGVEGPALVVAEVVASGRAVVAVWTVGAGSEGEIGRAHV